MLKEYLLTLVDYNYWSNGLILKYADRLKNEQYLERIAYSQKSIHEILVHVLFAEWVWRERLMGISPGKDEIFARYQPDEFTILDQLLDKWFDEEMKMRDFVEKFPEEKLADTFTYETTKGEKLENVFMDVYIHLVFHGMQHRAEAATILHNFNHSPGDIDFIRYIRQR